jgi:Tfp pilus assembly protein PilN
LIEVNLLPGGKKRSSKGRAFSFSLPKLGGGGGGGLPGDPYVLGAIGAAVVSFGIMGWLFFGVKGQREEAQVQVQEAVQDSIRFADVIKRTTELKARRDSIAQRVSIIQDIDAGRYTWPHVLDEVARALPEYTWLRSITQVSAGPPMQFRIAGRAGSTFAITNFMRRLEASEFLKGVKMERSEQAPSEQNPQDIVYAFELTVDYSPPPLDQLETVPLFDNDAAAAAPDSAGG